MANKIYLVEDAEIVIADTTDYAGDLGTRTHQIDLTSLAAGAARQSAKVDLELAAAAGKRPWLYNVFAAIEFAVAPTSLDRVSFYVGFSPSGTAGTANPGGLSGSDAAYTGTAGDSLDDSLTQLERIGDLVVTADATTVVQFGFIGTIEPLLRYGSFVVYNEADQAFVADAVEMGIALVPVSPEVQ